MTLLLDAVIRSSTVLLIGLLARHALARRSAALRHAVLTAALLGCAAAMPLSLVLPPLAIPALVHVGAPSTADVDLQPARRPQAPAAAVAAGASTDTVRRSHVAMTGVIWLLGAVVGLMALVAGLTRLVGVTTRASHLRDERWTRIAAQVAQRYGLRRPVALLETRSPTMLATWGGFAPRVLLPANARHWSDERIQIVLSHEFAHIRRHDWIVQVGAELLRVAYWFNPLVWLACATLRRDAEQACDDAVIAAEVPPLAYATHLLQLAAVCRRPVARTTLPIVGPRPSLLERRIVAMLNPHLDRGALSPRALLITALLAACATVSAAAVRVQQTAPLTLKGTVYDPSGAVLPEVAMTLENAQHAKLDATTDAAGAFEFTLVAPGTYVLEAALPGFKALRQTLDLKTARDWDRAITLQVGELQESIMVTTPRRTGGAVAAGAPERVRVGGNIRAPRKVRDVRPVYPAAMRDAGREGVVPLEAIIDRDGSVTSLRVVSAQVHPDFAIAAMEAVRQWQFTPTLLNGEPVEVVMNVSISFKLSE